MKKALLYVFGGVLLLLAVAYFIAGPLARRKVDAALRRLPPSVHVSYSSLDVAIFSGGVVFHGVNVAFDSSRLRIDRVSLSGIHFWKLLRSSSKVLVVGRVSVEGCIGAVDERLMDQPMPVFERPFDSVGVGEVEVRGVEITAHKGKRKRLFLKGGFEKDILRIDSARFWPAADKMELGRIKGHQVDCMEGHFSDVAVKGMDFRGLLDHRLTADSITIGKCFVAIFRDRRLPLEIGVKPMPREMLKELPVSLRVGAFMVRSGSFIYSEFPKEGDKMGALKVERLRCSIVPFINHPLKGDPEWLTIRSSGSLMGSGTVEATTRVSLQGEEVYEVEGAFHELDVTTLNPSAENLGKLHLESGMLNSLVFSFRMDKERSTGKIVGEYHDLVANKLKNDGRKVDKLKSFFLKKLIIPKDKDKSLPVSKRTGKVDYKRDPDRYFSYYLLHSLLVGVKSSFSLGFLLPG